MNKKKILIILILILLPSVYAFELTGFETSKDVCSGSTVLFTANAFGSGYFDVNIDGSAGAWATVVPNSFVLNNNGRTIYTYVTPNSNVIPGNYNLDLIVSNEQETKTETFDVIVNNCHGIQVSGDLTKEVCSCDLDVYSYTIINTGSYEELLNVVVDGSAKDFVTLSQDSLQLNQGESKIIYAYVDVPCNVEGDYDFTVKLENDKLVSSFDSNLKVNGCFDFDLNTDRDYVNFCEHSIDGVEVYIKNLGQNSNDFSINALGPLWANVDRNKVSINSLQEESVNLIFNPDYGVKGVFDIIIEVESDFGEVKKVKEVIADVKQCHGVVLDILESKGTICAGLDNNYEIKVKNIGEFEKEFKIETSEEWAKLSENLINLDADEEEIIDLEISPSLDLMGEYNVYIRANTLDSSLVESEDKIEVNVVSNEDCYMPEIKVDNLDVNKDSSATLPIVIENRGNEIADYNIIISGDGSSFSQINPANINGLEPGKSEVVYLYVAPSLEINKGSYKLNIGVMKDEVILNNKYIDINVKGALEYEEVKENFFDKIINWIKDLFAVEIVKEGVLSFEEEKLVSGDVNFVYEDVEHSLVIMDVSNDSVTVVIESDPVIVLLDIGESKNVDINGDGVNDLILTLDSIVDNVPYIKIIEIVPEEEEVIEEGEEFIEEEFDDELLNITEEEEIDDLILDEDELFGDNETDDLIEEDVEESLLDQIWNYKNYILYGVIIIIILIIIFKIFGKSEDDEDFFEEDGGDEKEDDEDLDDFDEDEEPLKIGRWIFGLVILGVLIYLGYTYYDLFNYSVFLNYLSVYKYYILIGIVVLIVLLSIIGYWKNIVDFFEEEIEEEEVEKKVKKKKVSNKKK
ncbi:MAG: hypothetical protein KJ674_03510 [Nanoarchaeota archaeon]|nr:hypothetical protein [Nanoarchaeota archaeon]